MQNDVTLDNLYAQPRESFIKKYGKRILGGVACSAAVAFVMHLPVIKIVILWGCQIVLWIFGHPPGMPTHGGHNPPIEDRIKVAVEKGKETLSKHHKEEGDPPKPIALPKAIIGPIKVAVAPVKEAVAVAKEVKDVKDKAADGVSSIKETGGKVAAAIGAVPRKVEEGAKGIGDKIGDALHARTEAKEKKDREALEAYAAIRGLKTDPSWTLPRLSGEVRKAEIEWNRLHGPNARCPNKRCRMPFRVKTTTTNETRVCPKCGTYFTDRQARASYTPPSMHIYNK